MHKLRWLVLSVCLLVLSACAPTLYTVNIRYEPTKPNPAADSVMKKQIITVANFNDVRIIDDQRKVGYVLRPDGRRIFILPDKVKAAEAVAAGVRDYLYKYGYSVSGMRPEWNLQEGTIDSTWGHIVIGGSINKLEIVCDDSQTLSPVKNYATVINLGITFAEITGKKIVYKTSVEGSASLTDVSVSVDNLEKQINSVLSDVIEKIFSGAEFRQQLQKVAAKP